MDSVDTMENVEKLNGFEEFLYSLPGMMINFSIVIAFLLVFISLMSRQRKTEKTGGHCRDGRGRQTDFRRFRGQAFDGLRITTRAGPQQRAKNVAERHKNH